MNAPECMNLKTSAEADIIRFLAADAVEQAQSGHPGAPMGMADIAEVLWREHLSHNPADPTWINRDRFILSNGHGSMLLYALLHLSGYDLSIDDLKAFRQLHSKTPGHPEVHLTPGVETTTGPLGQGLANAVGMALAETMLAAQFNRPEYKIIDHFTYVFMGDGCLMEGISHEVCSLAGTLKLGKLICFYDDNGISIDGDVAGWFTDDTPQRFEAYQWKVIRHVDGHDRAAIDAAIYEARTQDPQHARPTLICCKTRIGHGAPTKAGGHDVHGAPLGPDEIAAMRSAKGWRAGAFEVPGDLAAAWDARALGAQRQQQWEEQFAAYRALYPKDAAELLRRIRGELPTNLSTLFTDLLRPGADLSKKIASRKASQRVLEAISAAVPELFGGSADLSGSNLTDVTSSVWINHHAHGNYLSYGVREFGMAAMMNGMALYGGFIPYGGTFMTFSDYSRNAIRMAALMRRRVIHVLTHDSIGLGEDGPTHQPVEHAASLRMIPNNRLWRPCDGTETAIAWQAALLRDDGPTCLVLSRQALAPYQRTTLQQDQIARGGYVLEQSGEPQLILIATGSEVTVASDAAQLLRERDILVRVVSMPCVEVFYEQDDAYRATVLPPGIPRISIEAGVTWFWRGVVGETGVAMGIDSFGESAPADHLFKHFKLTPADVVATATALLARRTQLS